MNRIRLYAVLLSLVFWSCTCLAKTPDAHRLPHPDVCVTGWRLAATIHNQFTNPQQWTTSEAMPNGPVLGNGDLGTVLIGTPDNLRFCIDKTDFWGVIRGYILPMGSLQLNIPSLRSAACQVSQNIGPADVSGEFTAPRGAKLSFHSWVAADHDLLVIEFNNSGPKPLKISSQLLDAWGTTGSQPLAGNSADEAWLPVSPDTVEVVLGNQIKQPEPPNLPFEGEISDVKIYRAAEAPSSEPRLHRVFASWPSAADVQVLHNAHIEQRTAHGWALQIHGGLGAYASLGYLRLPQRQFTLSLWMRTSMAGQTAPLFAAQPGRFWPFGPQNYAGFWFGLVHGRLAARLNMTTAIAPINVTVPSHTWTHLMATYDGQTMRLFVDGRQVAATKPFPRGASPETWCPGGAPPSITTSFPPASAVMGAAKYSIHTGDPHIPFDGCGPKGMLALRVLGTPVHAAPGGLTFTIFPGHQATLLLRGSDDRKPRIAPYGSPNRSSFLAALTPSDVKHLYKVHLNWWKNFWEKSFVRIPEKNIQRAWYASLYLLACCSRPGRDPPGLWGTFVTTTHPAWQGDYHLDYNYEAPFWAAYPTNHVALAQNYPRPLLDYMPRGRAEARAAHYKGLYDYTCLIPVPGWDADPSYHLAQKCGTVFAAVNCVMHWRYTCSKAYARKIYPFLKATAEFWDHYLVYKNDRYMDYNDGAEEGSLGDTNPAATLAFLKMLYPALISMSRSLHVDAAKQVLWKHILHHLPPLPIVRAATINNIYSYPAGKTLGQIMGSNRVRGLWAIRLTETGHGFPRPRITGGHSIFSSGAGMASSLAIFPAGLIGLESPLRERQAAWGTVQLLGGWFDYNIDCFFYPDAAAAGYDPKIILHKMRMLIHYYQTSNFIIHAGGGGTENFAIIPTALSMMLLQSYQKNIHLFADWPADQDASFGNLLACGDFLVSSAIHGGRVQYARIVSHRGGVLRLANPWPGKAAGYSTSTGQSGVLYGSVLTLPTLPGETVRLTPK